MFKTKVILGSAAFVLLTVFVGQSLRGAAGRVRPVQRPDRSANISRVQRDPQQTREQAQKMMVARMKTQLEIDDAKWETVQPLLEKVVRLTGQLESRSLGGVYAVAGGLSRRGAAVGERGGPAGQPEPGQNLPGRSEQTATGEKTDLQKAADELQELLRSGTGESAAIKTALAAYRSAKNKVKEELAKAQADLKAQMTTPKQEATLVLAGLLN
ncbi:MAG: hypothetical protein JXN61_07560 [Sedimentisphaerales bacterium]|nr:hypothetical protein [Sedimentisphaerales bacterium]